MKKSSSPSKDMTVEEVIRVLVYRPYHQELSVMVDKDERIHIKDSSWLVILDHKTGEFHFSGELHKYYEVDTVQSIRDSFGEIYSVFNVLWDSIPVDTWIRVSDMESKEVYDMICEEKEKSRKDYHKEYYASNKEYREYRLKYQKEYYQRNREKILAKYYKKEYDKRDDD